MQTPGHNRMLMEMAGGGAAATGAGEAAGQP